MRTFSSIFSSLMSHLAHGAMVLWFAMLIACSNPTPPKAPHHVAGGGFKNLYGTSQTKSMWTFFKMRMSTQWADHEAQASAVPSVDPNLEGLQSSKNIQVTWLGHSTFLVQHHAFNLLTDPVFSERASPVSFAGPKRYTPLPIPISKLPKIHAVIISHNHYDHLDLDSISSIDQRDAPLWFVPLKNADLLIDEGVDSTRVIELDWWQQHERSIELLDNTKPVHVRLTSTPAQHWSARGLFDRFEMLWSSWSVDIDGWRLFFAGDTGFQEQLFREIGQKAGPFDFALIPIGAYAPRDFMKTMHINPQEAVQVHKLIQSVRSVGMHWGTFPLTAEPVIEPMSKLKEACESEGLKKDEFITIALGETLILTQPPVRPE